MFFLLSPMMCISVPVVELTISLLSDVKPSCIFVITCAVSGYAPQNKIIRTHKQ